jgi:hypothetical protein
VAALALTLSAALALSGCGVVDGTFPATSACPAEPRAAGTLPELEALLPRGMIERSPDRVDSGWNCLESSLGTYVAHGVTRIQFAGATWEQGEGGDGTVVAILASGPSDPPLQAAWVEEFYETGARGGRNIENIETRRGALGGAGEVWRLDALNSLSLQTIVVWPAAPYVRVVIVATQVAPDASRAEHDERVELAVEVATAVPLE